MILLLGGTSDTQTIAEQLAGHGFRVLVSQATETPLDVGRHEAIERRRGPLDDRGLAELIERRGIRVVVDATHPYAAEMHARARRVAAAMGLPCLSFVRPAAIGPDEPGVEFAADHNAAAAAAFAQGRAVLLTTGSNHLTPYVDCVRRTGQRLVVRVLGNPQSLAACRAAGLSAADILTGRGPFSVDENRRQIRMLDAGAMVTKDSGLAGGALEKLAAARLEACRLVVVRRPEGVEQAALADPAALVEAVLRLAGHEA